MRTSSKPELRVPQVDDGGWTPGSFGWYIHQVEMVDKLHGGGQDSVAAIYLSRVVAKAKEIPPIEPKDDPRRDFPKLTPVQKSTMLEFYETEHGELCVQGAKFLRTMWRLKAEGLVKQGSGNWWIITPRGKDYVEEKLTERVKGKLRG